MLDHHEALRLMARQDEARRRVARDTLAVSLALFAASVEKMVDKGIELSRKGEFAAAIQTFNDALALDPLAVNVLFYRGLLFHMFGFLQSAREDYAAVLALRPSDAHCRTNRVFLNWRSLPSSQLIAQACVCLRRLTRTTSNSFRPFATAPTRGPTWGCTSSAATSRRRWGGPSTPSPLTSARLLWPHSVSKRTLPQRPLRFASILRGGLRCGGWRG
jgi:tetratricopeptide (TPR) repeat protein